MKMITAQSILYKIDEALGLAGMTKLAELAGLSVTPTGAVIGGLGSVRALLNILGMGLLSERAYFLPKQANRALEYFPELTEFLNHRVEHDTFFTTLPRLIKESEGVLIQQSSDRKKASLIFFGELNEVKTVIRITDFPNPEIEEQMFKLVSGDFPEDSISFWSA
jgi:hypothetical protein